MVIIRCDRINDELMEVARLLSRRQREDVLVIGPTQKVEVHYEKVQEVQTTDKESESPPHQQVVESRL